MTFNLSGSSNDRHYFSQIKRGEGFLILPHGYYIKITPGLAVRVGLEKNHKLAKNDDGGIIIEYFEADNEVDKIYSNVSITME